MIGKPPSKIDFRIIVFIASFFTFSLHILGQDINELCRVFIEQSLDHINENCLNLNDEQACYALGDHAEVAATFYTNETPQVVYEDIFSSPADRADLIIKEPPQTLESLTTEMLFLDTDLDDDNDQILEPEEDDTRWGVAYQEVRANLPRQLEQNTAIFIIFGGTRIENAILPAEALVLLEDPLSLTPREEEIIVFSAPEDLGYLLPSMPIATTDEPLEADGISPDGVWLRVYFPYQRTFAVRATAWVKTEDFQMEEEELSLLPIIGPQSQTAMQTLYMRNELENPICAELPPPGLLIQGPKETETDLIINELPIRVTSSVYVEQISANLMRVRTLDGFAIIFPEQANQQVIPAGFEQVFCLSPLLDLGIDTRSNDQKVSYEEGCKSDPATEMPFGGFRELEGLPNIPQTTLNHAIILPRHVCPSGIGGARCTIQLPRPGMIQIQRVCTTRDLPAEVCRAYGF